MPAGGGDSHQVSLELGMNKVHHLNANQGARTASKASNCLQIQTRICSLGHQSLGENKMFFYGKQMYEDFKEKFLDSKCSSLPLN